MTEGEAKAEGARTLLMTGVKPTQDETLRKNAVHLYTKPGLFKEVNRLMRLDAPANEPEATLSPFIAVLQMAFIKR